MPSARHPALAATGSSACRLRALGSHQHLQSVEVPGGAPCPGNAARRRCWGGCGSRSHSWSPSCPWRHSGRGRPCCWPWRTARSSSRPLAGSCGPSTACRRPPWPTTTARAPLRARRSSGRRRRCPHSSAALSCPGVSPVQPLALSSRVRLRHPPALRSPPPPLSSTRSSTSTSHLHHPP